MRSARLHAGHWEGRRRGALGGRGAPVSSSSRGGGRLSDWILPADCASMLPNSVAFEPAATDDDYAHGARQRRNGMAALVSAAAARCAKPDPCAMSRNIRAFSGMVPRTNRLEVVGHGRACWPMAKFRSRRGHHDVTGQRAGSAIGQTPVQALRLCVQRCSDCGASCAAACELVCPTSK